MIIRLDMPLIDPSLRGGHVARWSKAVGDEIAFGEEICVVDLDDFAVLRRTARATLLAGRRRNKLKSDLETRSGKVLLKVSITSSDSGVLRKIVKEEGDEIAIGDTMAIVASPDHGDIGTEEQWAEAPAMRVVPNTVADGDYFEEGD
jgi:pyruvate/2-oxoglutarate dehydrogenase complex dihydrolipoamide acyltransferase (E2) component